MIKMIKILKLILLRNKKSKLYLNSYMNLIIKNRPINNNKMHETKIQMNYITKK